MTKLEFDAFKVGEIEVDGATVSPLTFMKLAAMYTEARTIRDVPLDVAVKRIRMTKQVAYTFQGKAVRLSVTDILLIPAVQGRKISKALDVGVGGQGKIIRDGDGTSKAIGFELADPIQMGGTNPAPIKELEFLAGTYGDLEAVLAGNDAIEQGIELLRTVAKPVHASLTSLPSAVIDRITVGDGIAIVNKVLPRFLADSAEGD